MVPSSCSARPTRCNAKGHIRTDSLYGGWSPRTQGIVDAVCYIVMFMPFAAIFLYFGWGYFLKAFMTGERFVSSPWMPITWPFKLAMPLTGCCWRCRAFPNSARASTPRSTVAGRMAPAWDPKASPRSSHEQRGLRPAGPGGLFGIIFIGFPIAFTLGAVALGTGFIAFGPMVFDLAVLQTFSVMKDTVLASIPFFLFMGFLLEQSGLMERMFTGIQQLLAGLRGSLYLAVLITATIFAAATGIVGSAVTLLGVMAGPAMIKSGYDTKMSAGAIAAGGTLGILIPPSVMLIVMGPVVGIPATDLFAAAVIPGLLLSTIFTVWCLVRCWLNPALGPALPPEMRATSMGAVVKDLVIGVVPVIVVIIATLGVILMGIATPTDAGAVGCAAVFILTLLSRRMTWPRSAARLTRRWKCRA
jgi:hypothetical protein